VAGNLVWFHTDFMLHNLPYMPKVVDKKQQIQAGVFISDRGGEVLGPCGE